MVLRNPSSFPKVQVHAKPQASLPCRCEVHLAYVRSEKNAAFRNVGERRLKRWQAHVETLIGSRIKDWSKLEKALAGWITPVVDSYN